jgi:DNA-binding winged helix-turn-helix (wHTH) protein
MSPDGDIEVGGLVIKPREHAVFANGRELDLTAREFEIVLTMAEHPGWVFSAAQLADESAENEFSPESVSVHVSRLRHKLAEMGAADQIETVRGIGYRVRATLNADDSSNRDSALRDAWWRLEQAVLEVDHSADALQRASAASALEEARRILYAILSE